MASSQPLDQEQQAFRAVAQDAQAKLDNINQEADQLRQYGVEVIDNLRKAMGKVYELAVLINGDYASTEPDGKPGSALASATVASFDDVVARVVEHIPFVAQLDANITDIETTLIVPEISKVDALQEQLGNERSTLENRLGEFQTKVADAHKSIEEQVTLRKHVEMMKVAHDYRNITVGDTTLNIGNLPGLSTEDKIRSAMEQIERAISNMSKEVQQLTTQGQDIEQQYRVVAQRYEVNTESRRLLHTALGNSKITASRIQSALRIATQLVLQATETSYAKSKQDIAVGLLRISYDAIIDPALADDATKVRDNVLDGYDGQPPDRVRGAADLVTEKIGRAANLPGFRNIGKRRDEI